MSKISQYVEQLVRPIAESLGLYLVEVNYVKQFDGMHLIVVIDKKEGVGIVDCEALHRAIDQPLDDLNPTDDQSYILNVSSPGLDRAIVTEWDFQKNSGKQVVVKLYAPYLGHKQYVGLLVSQTDEDVTILVDNKPITFKKSLTAKITPYIEF
ncbi:MAG: ribosome maturation factor RimP [Clostridia bacterium]